MCYLSTSPLDAGHGYSFELDSNSLSTLRISVRRSAFGEGSLADPVPLALGASHATTFSDGNSSYYAYTTGASPPTMISLLVKTQYGQTYPTSVSPSLTAKCQYEVCLYSGLAPNTTYVFTFRFFDDLPGVVRVLDMDVASGGDAAAATCLDFESGACRRFCRTRRRRADAARRDADGSRADDGARRAEPSSLRV